MWVMIKIKHIQGIKQEIGNDGFALWWVRFWNIRSAITYALLQRQRQQFGDDTRWCGVKSWGSSSTPRCQSNTWLLSYIICPLHYCKEYNSDSDVLKQTSTSLVTITRGENHELVITPSSTRSEYWLCLTPLHPPLDWHILVKYSENLWKIMKILIFHNK